MATRDGIAFPTLCRIHRVPEPVAELRFALRVGRDWRFDWAWPRRCVALEVEGGLFTRGQKGHAHATRIRQDMEKYNTAQILGWIVLRCLPEEITHDRTFEYIRRALDAHTPLTTGGIHHG